MGYCVSLSSYTRERIEFRFSTKTVFTGTGITMKRYGNQVWDCFTFVIEISISVRHSIYWNVSFVYNMIGIWVYLWVVVSAWKWFARTQVIFCVPYSHLYVAWLWISHQSSWHPHYITWWKLPGQQSHAGLLTWRGCCWLWVYIISYRMIQLTH